MAQTQLKSGPKALYNPPLVKMYGMDSDEWAAIVSYVKGQRFSLSNWVAEAIREKMQREQRFLNTLSSTDLLMRGTKGKKGKRASPASDQLDHTG